MFQGLERESIAGLYLLVRQSRILFPAIDSFWQFSSGADRKWFATRHCGLRIQLAIHIKLRFHAVASGFVHCWPLLLHQFFEGGERHPEVRAAKRALAATAKMIETTRRVGRSWGRSGIWRK